MIVFLFLSDLFVCYDDAHAAFYTVLAGIDISFSNVAGMDSSMFIHSCDTGVGA